MTQVRELNPGHIGGRRALSPLHHPCSPAYVSDGSLSLCLFFIDTLVIRVFIEIRFIVTLVIHALFVLCWVDSSLRDDVEHYFCFTSQCYVSFLPSFVFFDFFFVLECLISVSISILQFSFRKYLALVEGRLIDKKDDASNSR